MYKEALISGADDALIKGKGTARVIGSPEFSSRLTMEGGRHRFRLGRSHASHYPASPIKHIPSP